MSFELLHREVEQYIAQSNRELPGWIERAAFWFGWSAAGIGLMVAATSPRWFSAESVLPFVKASLFAEVAGFAVALFFTFRRELPRLWHAKRQHAEEMDLDFRKYQEIVAWLRRYPPDARRQRHRFVRNLKNNMTYRLGLATGGIERLGIFPVLIALYFQFKDWEWGDWSALSDVNLVGGLLIWAMVLFYGMGWMLIGLKVRLDTYESLLEESLLEE